MNWKKENVSQICSSPEETKAVFLVSLYIQDHTPVLQLESIHIIMDGRLKVYFCLSLRIMRTLIAG